VTASIKSHPALLYLEGEGWRSWRDEERGERNSGRKERVKGGRGGWREEGEGGGREGKVEGGRGGWREEGEGGGRNRRRREWSKSYGVQM